MSVKPTFDNIADWLAAKPAGHFTIERWGTGWAINIHQTGRPVETILVRTPGEVNRLRQQLSDAGMTGYSGGAA